MKSPTENITDVQPPIDLHQLIDEKAAALFLGVTRRTLQGWRQKGGGPSFARLSARCIRYKRRDLIKFSDEKLCSSTSEYLNPE